MTVAEQKILGLWSATADPGCYTPATAILRCLFAVKHLDNLTFAKRLQSKWVSKSDTQVAKALKLMNQYLELLPRKSAFEFHDLPALQDRKRKWILYVFLLYAALRRQYIGMRDITNSFIRANKRIPKELQSILTSDKMVATSGLHSDPSTLRDNVHVQRYLYQVLRIDKRCCVNLNNASSEPELSHGNKDLQ